LHREVWILDFHNPISPLSNLFCRFKLILFGANDAALPNTTGQHVPLLKYRENLKTLLSHSSIAAHNPTIFLVTPPPINEVQLKELDLQKGHGVLTRHQKVTAQYAEAIREIATEYKDKKVVLVDLWTALMLARLDPSSEKDEELRGLGESHGDEGLQKLLVDGLHLTGAGYKVFLDEIRPLVGKEWGDESLDKQEWIFP
jgi:isoamyl acetate esterase